MRGFFFSSAPQPSVFPRIWRGTRWFFHTYDAKTHVLDRRGEFRAKHWWIEMQKKPRWVFMLKKYSSHVQKKVDFKTRNFFLKKNKLPLSCMVEKDDENSSTAKHTLVSHYYISAVVFRFRHRSRRAGTGWGKVGKGCNERGGREMTASVATVETKAIFESDYCLTLLKWRRLAAWSRLFSTALANAYIRTVQATKLCTHTSLE